MLIIIATMFIILVFPSELMDFITFSCDSYCNWIEKLLLFRSLANLLQVVNFSCNFLVYVIWNMHFRTVAKEIVMCRTSLFERRPSFFVTGLATDTVWMCSTVSCCILQSFQCMIDVMFMACTVYSHISIYLMWGSLTENVEDSMITQHTNMNFIYVQI